VKRIEREVDSAKREAMIREALQIAKDDIAFLPLHQQPIVWASKRGVDLKQAPDNRFAPVVRQDAVAGCRKRPICRCPFRWVPPRRAPIETMSDFGLHLAFFDRRGKNECCAALGGDPRAGQRGATAGRALADPAGDAMVSDDRPGSARWRTF